MSDESREQMATDNNGYIPLLKLTHSIRLTRFALASCFIKNAPPFARCSDGMSTNSANSEKSFSRIKKGCEDCVEVEGERTNERTEMATICPHPLLK